MRTTSTFSDFNVGNVLCGEPEHGRVVEEADGHPLRGGRGAGSGQSDGRRREIRQGGTGVATANLERCPSRDVLRHFDLFLPRPRVVLLALLVAALVAGAGAPKAPRSRRADLQGEADGRRAGDAGPAAVRREGLVDGRREGRIHVPVVPLRSDGSALRTRFAASRRGATVLGANDVGHTLGLQVRATDSRGSTTAVSSLVGPIGGAPPQLASTVQPVISGEAVQGSTLKVDPGQVEPRAGVLQLPVGPLHR